MARIPDASAMLAPIEGAAPSTAVVAPTDFGFEQAGAQIESGAMAQRRASLLAIRAQSVQDKAAVQPQVVALQSANETDFRTAAADPAQVAAPGFVGSQYDNYVQRVERTAGADGLTPGQASEIRTQGMAHAAALAQQAGEAHANALAAPIAEQAKAQEASNLATGLTAFHADFAPAYEQLQLAHASGDTDLPQKTGTQFDASAGIAMAATPAAQRPALQAQLAGMRAAYMGDALDFQLKQGATAQMSGFATQAGTMANTVLSAPSGYQNAVDVLAPQAVAALPKGQQELAMADIRGQLAQARVKGLILAGEPAQARAELDAGTYDADLTGEHKQALEAEADAAVRDKKPRSLDEAVAQQDTETRAAAETIARVTTGKSSGMNAGDLSLLPLETQARILAGWKDADTTYAAGGAVRDMPTATLQGLASSGPPDPSDPAYETKLQVWQVQRAAAQEELKARSTDPGAWAWNSNGKGAAVRGPAGAAISIATDRGAALQQRWQAFSANPSDPHAAGQYAGTMLQVQHQVGVAPGALEIVPKQTAQSLAASVTAAPPGGRLAAMQSVARMLNGLPPSFRLADGTMAAPQAILTRQLLAAGMKPIEASAIVDFGSNPAALGKIVGALNDPTASKPLPGGQERILAAQVKTALAPEMRATAGMPGYEALDQARIDRTMLVARSLVNGGMNRTNAAATAAGDVTSGWRYVDTWRMPSAIAGGAQTSWATGTITDGAGMARNGAARILSDLTANNGAHLYAPPGQNAYATAVAGSATWRTLPDGGGLVLTTPKNDGSLQPVADKWGRQVSASWDQLNAIAKGAPSPFSTPPAGQAVTDKTLPAVSRQSAFEAVRRSIETQESAGRSGLTSPAGATGVMQVLPSSAAPYAQRLFGAPLDANRLTNDPDYNRRIGRAMLADGTNHFGPTPGGIVLNIAAYHDGQGNVEGYTDARGYHPGLIQRFGDPRSPNVSIDKWVDAIGAQAPRTQAYVRQVLPRAIQYLEGGG